MVGRPPKPLTTGGYLTVLSRLIQQVDTDPAIPPEVKHEMKELIGRLLSAVQKLLIKN
jgi:hypothetical protein